jgi:hypothetical protein
VEVREDEEQKIKLQEIIDLLVAAGYFRARIKGLSKKKIPVGTRFFAHVQTGPGVHPASCTMGAGSFPGVKRQGRVTNHPPPSWRRGRE